MKVTTINFDKIPVKGLVRIPVIGDGSCFFHAVLTGLSKTYNSLSDRKKQIMVANLRQRLAEELSEEKYLSLSNGELKNISNSVNKFIDLSLNGLRKSLDSRSFAGQEHLELTSNELNIDIYIIDIDKKDLYRLGDTKIYYRSRPSIIIGYLESNMHYELIGLKRADEIITLFDAKHEIIETLKNMQK